MDAHHPVLRYYSPLRMGVVGRSLEQDTNPLGAVIVHEPNGFLVNGFEIPGHAVDPEFGAPLGHVVWLPHQVLSFT